MKSFKHFFSEAMIKPNLVPIKTILETIRNDLKKLNKLPTSEKSLEKIFNKHFKNLKIKWLGLSSGNVYSPDTGLRGGITLTGSKKELGEIIVFYVKNDFLDIITNFLNDDDFFNYASGSIEKEGKNTFTVFAFGLGEQDYKESFDIVGEQVINAEVEDLNSDGSPELLICTQSIGSGSYGNVYAFSVNNKKSISQVYFQPTAENKKINQWYMGHDEFSVLENSLIQRFPIYQENDSNANPTGGTRQVSYTLIDGEAMRKLEVNQVWDDKS